MSELDWERDCRLMRLTLHGLETDCIWAVTKLEKLKMSPRFWVGGSGVWVEVTELGTINSVMTTINTGNQSVWLL